MISSLTMITCLTAYLAEKMMICAIADFSASKYSPLARRKLTASPQKIKKLGQASGCPCSSCEFGALGLLIRTFKLMGLGMRVNGNHTFPLAPTKSILRGMAFPPLSPAYMCVPVLDVVTALRGRASRVRSCARSILRSACTSTRALICAWLPSPSRAKLS